MQRPLTVHELQHSLAVSPGDDDLDPDALLTDEDALVEFCAGLVVIDKVSDTIRLVHPTTIEYFESTRPDSSKAEKDIRFPKAQEDIVTRCLTYLLFRAFSDGPCPDDEAMETRMQQNALLQYAAQHWVATHAGNLRR